MFKRRLRGQEQLKLDAEYYFELKRYPVRLAISSSKHFEQKVPWLIKGTSNKGLEGDLIRSHVKKNLKTDT